MTDFKVVAAFLGGLASFLAPCVLPLIPGFLAYISGTTVGESKSHRYTVFLNSVFFVLGFSLVFSLLGVLLQTILANVAYEVQTWLARIGGVIIIFFGLYLTGLIKINFLKSEKKLSIQRKDGRSSYLTSFLFGLAFAAGWTPCVGPVLAGILGLAATAPGSAFGLLVAYTMGLGLPFLIVGFFTGEALGFIQKFRSKLRYAELVFGLLLIGLGILIFTENLSLVANFDFLNKLITK
ncbi:cytochrome C biogenesis protein [Candidatus Gracilibacteria bacterium]|jgi:cytochrome c-type biogenesis protein|nr:cytochrome C biogenesis protein [Candidatus Gracilibacteria bacterium]